MKNNRLLTYTWLLTILFLPFASIGQVTAIRHNDGNNIICEFSLPQYTIVDTVLPIEYGVSTQFKYIRMSDPSSSVYDSVGFPELPFLSYSFEIPYNACNCEIEMTDIQYDIFNIEGHILPNQIDNIWDDTLTRLPFSINTSCYSSNHEFIPRECFLSEPFIIRGKKGVRAVILPFKYSPFRNQLKVITSAKISINYSIDQATPEYVASETWDNIYRAVFVNHVQNRQLTDGENYLIITLPQFKEAIQYFADYKQSLGYNVNIVSLEQDQRDSAAIRQIIQDLYDDQSSRPDFVLLVGDHPDLPAYSGDNYCGDSQNEDNPITDVPYVFLEGDDFYRDALIGRWPVSTVTEVQTIANKTIYMEMNMHQYEKKAVFIAGYDNNPISMHFYELGLENIQEGNFSSLGYTCSLLYQPDENLAEWELNNNPLLYIYSGHGDCYSWGAIDEYSWSINVNFFQNSTKKTYPMIFAFACKTGNYAYSAGTNIAESWMRLLHGGVTYLGSSIVTHPVSDNRIEEKLFGDAFRDEKAIGGMIAVGMNRYFDSFFTLSSRARKYMKSYNLMGDPSFRINGLGCINEYYVNQLYLRSGDVQYYRASETVTFSDNVNVGNGSELIIRAGNEINFKDGFSASAGAEMSAVIEECVEYQRTEQSTEETFEEKESKSTHSAADRTSSSIVNVYPNPTQGQVSIDIFYSMKGKMNIQIMDIFGRQVMETEDNIETGPYHKTIDVSTLPTGCYYVVVAVNEKKNVKCIIKQ